MIRPETWAAIVALEAPRIAVDAHGSLTLARQVFVYDRLGLRPAASGGVQP
jgi:hypothetical protein